MNTKKYRFNNKDIYLVGVDHSKREINTKIIRDIIDYANTKSKVCYLIEYDRRLTNRELKANIPKFEELTTKLIVSELKREYGELYDRLCIRGWDVRAALMDSDLSGKKENKKIGRSNQNKLYSPQMVNANIKIIQNYIQRLPNNYQVNINKFNKKIGKYLNDSFKNEDTYFSLRKKDNNQSYYDWLIYNVKGYISHIKSRREPESYTIRELIPIFGEEHLVKLIFHIQLAYQRVSDLFLMEKLLEQDNDTNYIVFMGLFHYNNVVNHFKNLGIN